MQRREFLTRSAALAVAVPTVGLARPSAPRSLTIVHGRSLSPGWRFGLKDLDRYLIRAGVRVARRAIHSSAAVPDGLVVVLVDRDDRSLADLRSRFSAGPSAGVPGSFSISTHRRTGATEAQIYFLEGWDVTGQQYCCYDFLERFAGIRFLHPDFEHVPTFSDRAPLIDTGLLEPGFTNRGLYPWNYNYDERGLTTFCDINARFIAKDWSWFARLGAWLIKNKQNTLFWFDDVFNDDPLSARFPRSLRQHWEERGLKQVLGMGWASNEGRPRGGGWEQLTCLDANGRSIEEADWRKAVCPQVPQYLQLADRNTAGIDFKAPAALGALIGYGENSWAAHQKSACVRHSSRPADAIMGRDLQFIVEKMKKAGAQDLPLGFVISTHSVKPDSPFRSGNIINSLPANGIVSMHVYQQDAWTSFADVLSKMRARNQRDGLHIKAVPIAEVAFLCNYDIPLFRPSILRRREAHMRSIPRVDVMAHLVTLNTTQYLYWLKSYQLMRWQWSTPAASWGEEMGILGEDLFGRSNRPIFSDLIARLAALDLLQPADCREGLMTSSEDLTRISAWSRYTPSAHSDDFGFFLWAKGHDKAALDDAARNVATCLQLNEQLTRAAGPLYRNHFSDTFALTAHYHAIRVHCGQADLAIIDADNCPEPERSAYLAAALAYLSKARSSLSAYDLLRDRLVGPLTEASRRSLKQDFVLNPSSQFLDQRREDIISSSRRGDLPKRLFDQA